jgi:hypothetical protein
MSKKTADVSTRLTPDELDKRSMDARIGVMEEALKAEKVHYKSQCNSEKFKKFLEHRLTIWDELKDKTFYAKRMHAKTQEVLTGISGQTQA